MLVLDDDFVIAEWALLQTVETRSLDLLALLDALVELEKLRGEEATELRLGERELAAGLVHADDRRIMFTKECRSIGRHTIDTEEVRVRALGHLAL